MDNIDVNESVSQLSEKKPFSLRSFFMRWEWILIFFMVIVVLINSNISPHFFVVRSLFDMTFNFMEKSMVTLVMAYIIIIGEIDLSVASNMAMSSVIMGVFYQMGINIWISMLIGLSIGTLGGFFNGIIITRVKLHSIIITLATYSLFRGIAYVILGNKAVTNYPTNFSYLGQGYIGKSVVNLELVVFLVLAFIFGIILHKFKFGRYLYAIGNNKIACRFSGIPVDRIKVIIFTLSGFISALAGIFLTSRIDTSRPNIAYGFTLEIVTAVVLGGVSIYGGSGSMIGVVLSVFLIGLARYGMSLVNIPSQVMSIAIGFLLIIAILLPKLLTNITKKVTS